MTKSRFWSALFRLETSTVADKLYAKALTDAIEQICSERRLIGLGANQADRPLRALPASLAEFRRPKGPGLGVPLRYWITDADQLLAAFFLPSIFIISARNCSRYWACRMKGPVSAPGKNS